MGRPKGSKNKPAEAGIGHNSAKLTDEQEQALFFQHKAGIARLKAEMAAVNSRLRNAYKIAKAEGFPKREIDFALSLENDEDAAALERRRRETIIARWMGHPIGTQPDLFDGDGTDRTPLVDRAFSEGKRAGMQGEDCSSPHDVATEAGQAWVKGWHDGQKALFDIKELKEGTALIKTAPAPANDAFDDALDNEHHDDEGDAA